MKTSVAMLGYGAMVGAMVGAKVGPVGSGVGAAVGAGRITLATKLRESPSGFGC